MRTVLRNHQEACHVWASQFQSEGRSGNINFEGPVIYSYRHWPFARFADKQTVLFRDETYSVSTSGHQSLARQAVSHCKIFTVAYISGQALDHEKNITHYQLKMRVMADKFWNSVTDGEYHLLDYRRIRDEAKEYAKYFNCESLLPFLFGWELSGNKAKDKLEPQEIKRQAAKVRYDKEHAERHARREEAKAKIQDQLDRMESEWIGGSQINRSIESDGLVFWYEFSQTRLRLKPTEPDMIETSQRAYVPLAAGKLLYDRIAAGKDVRLHQIGSYQVISFNGVLKIGCHEITREEIDRFALSVGWC